MPLPRVEPPAPVIPGLERFAALVPRTGRERLADETVAIALELSKRQREGLRLYEPQEHQLAFHQSSCRTRIARGSTRSGKTLASAVDVAWAVTNTDPCGRYPSQGVVYVVGFTSKHHSKVTYPKLFKPGAVKCIIDPDTRKWRAFRPWQEWDAANADKAIDAEPLIPARYVETVAWENAREEIPSMVRLTTGWTIYFFSGEGKPPRGQAIDIGWMDEEIGNEQWYSELVSRCVDRRGKIIWSAAPQTGTEQLYELSELAASQYGSPDAVVEEHVMKLAANRFIGQREKDEMAAAITSEVERQVRIDGEFVLDTQKVYPEFSLAAHGWDLPRVPSHWTRSIYVDPGHQFAVALFAAAPPDDESECPGTILLYDEVYLPRANAVTFAKAVAEKAGGQSFERFVIDYRGSRSTEAGSGLSIVEQYGDAFRVNNLKCRATGSALAFGSDDLMAGLEKVRAAMLPGPRGRPRLRVLVERTGFGSLVSRLPNFAWEIGRYRHQRIGAVVTNKPDQRGRVHAMDAMRYCVMDGPRYVPYSPPPESEGSPAWKELQKKLRTGPRRATVFGPASAEGN